MNMKKFAILGLIFLLFSCQNTAKTIISPLGYEFFPLEIGRFVIYEVNKTSYFSSNPPEKKQYQLKEVITDSFVNEMGQKVYVVERSVRDNETQNWKIATVLSAYISNNQLVVMDNNISFVKLSFPVKEGLIWNGNFYNNYSRENYVITDFNKSFIINNLTFEKTLKVKQGEETPDFTKFQFREEIFAENVGLISIEATNIVYKQSNINKEIELGTIIQQKIIAYGKK